MDTDRIQSMYDRGRYIEAARLADVEVEEEPDADDRARLLLRAAVAWSEAGHYRRAAARLMRFLALGDAVKEAEWELLAKVLAAKAAIHASFDAQTVDFLIWEVGAQVQASGGRWRRALLKLKGEREMVGCNWGAAQQLMESASAVELPSGSILGLTSCSARLLREQVWCCLMAERLPAAERALEELGQYYDGSSVCCKYRALVCKVDVALARADVEGASALSGEFLREADSMSCYDVDQWAVDRRVRVLLLVSEQIDPLSVTHPAFAVLRRSRRETFGLKERFELSLLYLDYRLACVRYAGGHMAVDDLFGIAKGPQPSEAPRGDSEVSKRRRRARASANRAMHHAKALDEKWGTSWYEDIVRGRLARLRAIGEDAGS